MSEDGYVDNPNFRDEALINHAAELLGMTRSRCSNDPPYIALELDSNEDADYLANIQEFLDVTGMPTGFGINLGTNTHMQKLKLRDYAQAYNMEGTNGRNPDFETCGAPYPEWVDPFPQLNLW